MEIKRLETRAVKVEELNPAEYNPRQDLQPGNPAYEKIKNSILEFGYIDPIIWNEYTGNIVGGHQRFKILKAEIKDLKEVDVSVVHIEDPDKEKTLNIALNRTGGDWDEEKLGAILSELDEDDLQLTGFMDDELEDYLSKYEPDDATFRDDPDDYDPDEQAELIVEPYVQDGDIWEIGEHRLVCGDSLDPDTVQDATGGAQVNMVFTDPPYNVALNSGTPEDLKRRKRRTDGKLISNDSMDDESFYLFLVESYKRAIEITKQGGPIYVCHADAQGLNFRQAAKEAGWNITQNLIWVKNMIVLGRQDYHWQHEPILYGWKPGAAHFWNGERDKSTVYNDEMDLRDLDKKELIQVIRDLLNEDNTTVYRHPKPSRSSDHPTMKPLPLVRHYIKNSSIRGHIVYDGFLGSGSTLIAADQLERKCCGIEKDPRYCQVIIERYIDHKDNDGENITVIRKGKRIPYHEAALMYVEEVR